MKKLSKREKILLAVLIVLVVGVCWYKLVYEPVNTSISQYNSDRDTEQTELLTFLPKVEQKRKMQAEVDVLKAQPDAVKIPSFDNTKEIMKALNKVLSAADTYSLSFSDPVKDGYIYSHKVDIKYSADNYRQARRIIDRLAKEAFVNQISDITINNDISNKHMINANGEDVNISESETNVSLVITFFEIAA